MRIAMCLQDLAGGGAERVAVTLANELQRQGCEVRLALVRRQGAYLEQVSPLVPIDGVAGGRTALAIPALAQWIRKTRPDVVVAHLTHMNVAAVLAGGLAGGRAPVVVVEHNQMDLNYARLTSGAVRHAYRATRWAYDGAAKIVCVSQGVAESVAAFTKQTNAKLTVIPNPVIPPDIEALCKARPIHPWLEDNALPAYVACGRLVEQKGFDTLLNAFALVRRQRPARLIILGDGELRPQLEQLAKQLGVDEAVAMPGFTHASIAHFAAASAFVLSSNWEGMPTVLIEAAATGCPLVATDCRSGPREILEGGALGQLCPPGNTQALCDAMLRILDHPGDAAARLARVAPYRTDQAARAYRTLFDSVIEERRHA